MAIPGTKKNSKMRRFWAAEEVIHRRIDRTTELMECLTPLEILAINIACCNQRPAGKYTRKWACKVIEEIGVAKCTGLIVAEILGKSDVGTAKALMEYLPKSERLEITGADGKDFNPTTPPNFQFVFVKPKAESEQD